MNAQNPAASPPVVFATVCTETGAVMAITVEDAAARRYLELHAILPEDLTSWSEADLEELIEELEPEHSDTWERILMLLAHHRSWRASALIRELRAVLPADLSAFGELAYAESLGWLGFDYIRYEPGAEPVIRPAREEASRFT